MQTHNLLGNLPTFVSFSSLYRVIKLLYGTLILFTLVTALSIKSLQLQHKQTHVFEVIHYRLCELLEIEFSWMKDTVLSLLHDVKKGGANLRVVAGLV